MIFGRMSAVGLLAALSLLASTAAAPARQPSDWFAERERFETMYKEGRRDAALLYNLGTAYAHTGDDGRALWMLLRARSLAPRDPDIRHNLDRLAPDLRPQMAIFPVPPIQYVYELLTLNEWAAIAAALTVPAGLLFALIFWLGAKLGLDRRLARRFAFALMVLAAVAHVVAGVKFYEERIKQRGIVVAQEVYGRSLPSDDADPDPYPLPPGTFIFIDDAGVEGWIKATYMGRHEVFLRRNQVEFL